MAELLPALAALVGTLAGVAATFVLARAKQSGRATTSDARTLWEASESIRRDLTTRIGVLEARVAAVEAENLALRAELRRLAG